MMQTAIIIPFGKGLGFISTERRGINKAERKDVRDSVLKSKYKTINSNTQLNITNFGGLQINNRENKKNKSKAVKLGLLKPNVKALI